jgi:AraC-like DNA-binding protein
LSKSTLKRLAEVEKKLAEQDQSIEDKKQGADLNSLLYMYDYTLKRREMEMTPEEIRKDNEEGSEDFL